MDSAESNSNPSAESKQPSINTSADNGAEASSHAELSLSIGSDLSGDEVLNWRLSGVDFESPAKLKIILRQSDESEPISSQEQSENRLGSAGDELYAPSANEDSEVGSLWSADREDLAVQARPLPDPEPKFRFQPKVTNGHHRKPTVTHGMSSVEFSVPLTQYLYVPSISTSDFPLIQASFSDIEGRRTEGVVGTSHCGQWDSVGARRIQISCILLLKKWAHIARQRGIVRNAAADDEWNRRQHQYNRLVLGFGRTFDKFFKVWVVYAAWKTSCKSLSLLCTRQISGIVFLQWKAVSRENAFLEQTEQLKRSVRTVTIAAHEAHVAMSSCGEIIAWDMWGYTNLLCRSVSVRSWLRSPTPSESRRLIFSAIPRAFFSWKDAVRDSKLVQLHWRIEQIEALLASEPDAQTQQRVIDSVGSRGAKFDRICLEKLSREMLLSVGRGKDDELQERIVLLLQIVTEVNQAAD
jgi:hypothetical protein